jgi:hypothetical protein
MCDSPACEGFRMTAHRDDEACTAPVVRKPPVKERAGDEGPTVTRALWRFDRGVDGGRKTRQRGRQEMAGAGGSIGAEVSRIPATIKGNIIPKIDRKATLHGVVFDILVWERARPRHRRLVGVRPFRKLGAEVQERRGPKRRGSPRPERNRDVVGREARRIGEHQHVAEGDGHPCPATGLTADHGER